MIYNKKGVSTIVITVIMVALVLVAIGVVWGVLSGVIFGGVEDIDWAAKCLNVEVKATGVTCAGDPAICSVTFERTGTSDEAISGVKVKFKNAVGASSSVFDETHFVGLGGDIAKLVGEKVEDINTGIATPNKIEVTVYFKDLSGNMQLCSQTTTFSF